MEKDLMKMFQVMVVGSDARAFFSDLMDAGSNPTGCRGRLFYYSPLLTLNKALLSSAKTASKLRYLN